MSEDPGLRLHLASWPPEKQPEQHKGQAIVHDRLHNKPERLRVLMSYWYYKDTDLDKLMTEYFKEPYPEIFADSGAFSGMTQGVSIEVDEYAEWLKRWSHWIGTYANLDVIRHPELTWYHQQRLEDHHGLFPLPVFHVATDWSWLEHYIERYPYIALGVAGSRSAQYMGWAVKCFQMAGDRAVYHGFGITSWQVLKNFPWYSVDSTSWGQGFKFGSVPVFDAKRGRWHKLPLGDRKAWYKNAHLVRALGFDPADFADRERNDRTTICAISALSYINAEQWLRRWHGEIHIPDRSGEPGIRNYFVVGGDPTANMSANALRAGIEEARDRDPGLNVYLGAAGYFGPATNLISAHDGLIRDDAGLRCYLADTTGRDTPNVNRKVYDDD